MFQGKERINGAVIRGISVQADSEEAVPFISTFIPLFEVNAASRLALIGVARVARPSITRAR